MASGLQKRLEEKLKIAVRKLFSWHGGHLGRGLHKLAEQHNGE